jgi:hypothetical protein
MVSVSYKRTDTKIVICQMFCLRELDHQATTANRAARKTTNKGLCCLVPSHQSLIRKLILVASLASSLGNERLGTRQEIASCTSLIGG